MSTCTTTVHFIRERERGIETVCVCVVIVQTCCYSCINTVRLSTHYISTMGQLKSEGEEEWGRERGEGRGTLIDAKIRLQGNEFKFKANVKCTTVIIIKNSMVQTLNILSQLLWRPLVLLVQNLLQQIYGYRLLPSVIDINVYMCNTILLFVTMIVLIACYIKPLILIHVAAVIVTLPLTFILYFVSSLISYHVSSLPSPPQF